MRESRLAGELRVSAQTLRQAARDAKNALRIDHSDPGAWYGEMTNGLGGPTGEFTGLMHPELVEPLAATMEAVAGQIALRKTDCDSGCDSCGNHLWPFHMIGPTRCWSPINVHGQPSDHSWCDCPHVVLATTVNRSVYPRRRNSPFKGVAYYRDLLDQQAAEIFALESALSEASALNQRHLFCDTALSAATRRADQADKSAKAWQDTARLHSVNSDFWQAKYQGCSAALTELQAEYDDCLTALNRAENHNADNCSVVIERDEALARLAKLEHTLDWNTTCTGCADKLDVDIVETEAKERAEAINHDIDKLHQVTGPRCLVCDDKDKDEANPACTHFMRHCRTCYHLSWPCETRKILDRAEGPK